MHDQLPNVYRLTLRDDSLAPDLRQGDYVELQRDLAGSAATGDWVLVRTARGEHLLREYIGLGGGEWAAAPVGQAGETVTSQSGAVVVAVYVGGGVSGRMSQR